MGLNRGRTISFEEAMNLPLNEFVTLRRIKILMDIAEKKRMEQEEKEKAAEEKNARRGGKQNPSVAHKQPGFTRRQLQEIEDELL